ncbi:MAG TPA: hypothetical protein PK890_09205, partial [Terrimesophilobacter sp.]|nr:hypothetical protein [Terrimesophilobacter sp.]
RGPEHPAEEHGEQGQRHPLMLFARSEMTEILRRSVLRPSNRPADAGFSVISGATLVVSSGWGRRMPGLSRG